MPTELAIAAALDNEDLGVVGEAVEGGTGQELIGEDLWLFLQSAVTGHQDRVAFVALADDLIEIIDGLG